MKPYSSIIGVAVWLASFGCSAATPSANKDASKDAAKDQSASQPASLTSDAIVAVKREKFDAAQLIVSNIAVINSLENGIEKRLADFRYSGAADYLELTICTNKDPSQPEVCAPPKMIKSSRAALGIYPVGTVVLKARACLDPDRALTPGVVCGSAPPKEVTYEQGPVLNPELITLYAQVESGEKNIADLSTRMQNVLQTFMDDSKKCADRAAAKAQALATRSMIGNFLQMGQSLISMAMQGGVPSLPKMALTNPALSLTNDGGNLITTINQEDVSKLGISFETSGKVLEQAAANPAQQQQAQTVQNAGAQMAANQLVAALPQLGNAIFDLSNSQTLAQSDTCLAQSIAQSEMGALNALRLSYIAQRDRAALRIQTLEKAGGQ